MDVNFKIKIDENKELKTAGIVLYSLALLSQCISVKYFSGSENSYHHSAGNE